MMSGKRMYPAYHVTWRALQALLGQRLEAQNGFPKKPRSISFSGDSARLLLDTNPSQIVCPWMDDQANFSEGAQSVCVCVCVHSCFQGHYPNSF